SAPSPKRWWGRVVSRQADEPTDEEEVGAAEAFFTYQYPSFQYVGDDWVRDYARVALAAAAGARARATSDQQGGAS
ncbi:hypothetical protein, partial [Staphylococcus aureus]